MAEEKARGDVEVVELSAAAQAHARRVAESMATIPHFHLEIVAKGSPSAAAVVRACGLALREHPQVNGAYRDGRFELYSRVNVALGVSVQDTVLFPTIDDADRKAEAEIAAEVETLTERAREGAITQPELSGATFSLVDVRAHGITRATGVVRGGQAAQLTIGVADAGTTLTLACDSRILQGREAPDFLARVRALLEEPA